MASEKKINITDIISLTVADIDIFLLKEKDQQTDKNISFSANEIRKQLQESSEKIISVLVDFGYDVKLPLKASYPKRLDLRVAKQSKKATKELDDFLQYGELPTED